MHFLPSQSTLTFPSYPLPFSEISFIDFHFLAEGHIKGPTGLQVYLFDHGKSLLIPKRPFVYFWDSYDFGRYRDLKMNGENLAKHVLHFRFWYSGVQTSYSWIFASSPGSFEYRINFSFIHCRPLASQCFEQNPSLSLLSFPMSLIWQIPRTTSPISSSASSWGSYDRFIYALQPEVLPLHLKWSNCSGRRIIKSFLFCRTKNILFSHRICFVPIYSLGAICQQDAQNLHCLANNMETDILYSYNYDLTDMANHKMADLLLTCA